MLYFPISFPMILTPEPGDSDSPERRIEVEGKWGPSSGPEPNEEFIPTAVYFHNKDILPTLSKYEINEILDEAHDNGSYGAAVANYEEYLAERDRAN